MDNLFYCKSKQLARYLENHGSKLIDASVIDNVFTYTFEYDESIEKNIESYKEDKKKCLF